MLEDGKTYFSHETSIDDKSDLSNTKKTPKQQAK